MGKMDSISSMFYFRKILIQIILSSSAGYHPLKQSGTQFICVSHVMHATCPFHFIFPHLIAMMLYGDVHNYETPYYAVFARRLLLPLTQVTAAP
jgi:hypothetical protein